MSVPSPLHIRGRPMHTLCTDRRQALVFTLAVIQRTTGTLLTMQHTGMCRIISKHLHRGSHRWTLPRARNLKIQLRRVVLPGTSGQAPFPLRAKVSCVGLSLHAMNPCHRFHLRRRHGLCHRINLETRLTEDIAERSKKIEHRWDLLQDARIAYEVYLALVIKMNVNVYTNIKKIYELV